MRKLLVCIICSFLFFSHAHAFLGEDLGGDMYKNLDTGFDELEKLQYGYELSGQGEGIKEYINSILKVLGFGECIKEDISSDQVTKISEGDIAMLTSKMDAKCNPSDIGNITKIQKTIQDIQKVIQKRAIEKSTQIHKISRIGLYSDGNIKNSGFDLIKDLQDIDDIIFASKTIYEGEENNENTDNTLNNILNKAKDGVNKLLPNENNSNNNTPPDNGNNGNGNGNNNQNNSTNICIDPKSSGLNINTLNNILNEAQNNTAQGGPAKQSPTPSSGISSAQTPKNTSKSPFNYIQMTDIWPCYDFFCITVQFIIYQHKILGGSDNITIEYLLNRSNTHFKKFANASLLPSQMTNNNFELGFKNLHLPDIFHLGFVITTRPVWILDTNSNTSEGLRSNKSLLNQLFTNRGLNYTRKNDIKIFKKEEEEEKTVTNAGELSNNEVVKKNNDYFVVTKAEPQEKINLILEKTIEAQTLGSEFETFEEQFTQLEGFSNTMFDYVQSINKMILGMDKIPVEK